MDNRRKQILFPFAQNDRLLLNEAPLLAFCAARIGSGNATLIRPMAAEHVSRIAYASTALQISGDDGLTYRRIRVAAEGSGGCFELQLGADRAGVADAIAAFLDTKRPTAPALNRSASRLKLSVIIPVYNGAHFIGQAVESIVEQDYPGCEIIVVDDGSTDDLASALDRITADVTLIRQSNRGPAAARNAGIKAASGELLAFLDADDLWPQARLELLLAELALHPHADVIEGKAKAFLGKAEDGSILRTTDPRETYPYFIGAGLYRREAFDTVGLFDEAMRYGEDTDWFLRAAREIRVVTIPEVTLLLRQHEANMTRDLQKAQRGNLEALKRHLERKRNATKGVKSVLDRPVRASE